MTASPNSGARRQRATASAVNAARPSQSLQWCAPARRYRLKASIVRVVRPDRASFGPPGLVPSTRLVRRDPVCGTFAALEPVRLGAACHGLRSEARVLLVAYPAAGQDLPSEECR